MADLFGDASFHDQLSGPVKEQEDADNIKVLSPSLPFLNPCTVRKHCRYAATVFITLMTTGDMYCRLWYVHGL